MEKFGARAELRYILQEKLRGRGANIWRFDSRFVFFGGGGNCRQCNTGGMYMFICFSTGCETRVDLATHSTPIQLPSRIQGAMHRASTLSSELAALGVSVGRTCPARRLKSLLFSEIYCRVRTYHKSSQRHLWVACMCRACETCRRPPPYGRPHRSSRRRRRQGGRRSRGTRGRRERP